MRRILGALLCLALWSSTALAKGLVIVTSASTATANAGIGARRELEYVVNILNNQGASFDAIEETQIAPSIGTQLLRRGRLYRPAFGDTVSYNPIIHVGFRAAEFSSPYGNAGSAYRPDSLLLKVQNYPSVTHLFIGNANDGESFFTSSRCSSGVGRYSLYSSNSHMDSSMVTYVVGNPAIRWVQTNGGATCVVNATRDTRGFRPMWGMRSSAHSGTMTTNSASDWAVYDNSFDGTYPTDPDTVSFWLILNHAAGSDNPLKSGTQAAAVPMGLIQPANHYGATNGEITPFVAALAWADSASGGGLYGTGENRRLPRCFSVHIDDGWKRGNPKNGLVGGMAIADSSFFIASIDSLAALNEKMVLGVEIDSVVWKAGYDDRWWGRMGSNLHYTPHCHSGTTTQTGQIQDIQVTAGPYWRMQDLWGFGRTRVIFGDGTGLGQDSSFYSLHKRAFGLMDSLFSRRCVDHFAMPPFDDWSPNTSTSPTFNPMPNGFDSVAAAFYAAGGRGIRANAGSNTSRVSMRIGTYGYFDGPIDYAITLVGPDGVDRRGQRSRILACPTYPQNGSSVSFSRYSTGQGIRAFNSIFLGRFVLANTGSDFTDNQKVEAAILTIHAGDLCSDKYGRATRPGFYSIKYPVMAMRAINAVARRPIVRCVYPEELQP